MSSKDLLYLLKIQNSFEILEKLKNIPGNKELNNLWNNLLDIRDNQINILKQNDQFKLFDSIKLLNVKDSSSQYDNSNVVKSQYNMYLNNMYSNK